MRHIGRFVRELPHVLSGAGAAALIEIDPPIENPVLETIRRAMPGAGAQVLPDLAGLARCVEITVA